MSKHIGEFRFVPFAEFCSSRYHREMKRQLSLWGRLHCAMYASPMLRKAKHKLTGTPPQFKQVRRAQLTSNLQGIDLQHDALG